MDKIILKLLKENGRVIIPDFGALIVKQKTPFTVIFNEFLQYNDGALIGAIADEMKIDRDEAAAKAKEMTRELQDKLKSGGNVELKDIGTLSKSSTGKISLNDPDAAPKTEQPKSIKTEKTDTKDTRTVEFDIEEKKTVDKEPKTTPKAKDPVETKPKTSPVKETTAKTPTPEPIRKETFTEIKKDTPRKEKNETISPIHDYYNEEGKKSKTGIIIWIFVILIVNGAMIIGFFKFRDEIKAFIGRDNSTKQVSAPVEEINENESLIETIDSVVNKDDTVPLIETPAEEVEEPQPSQEMFAGTKYYVVAGVFREESNADNLVIKLRQRGYTNAEKFGRIGYMHAVSYDVFPTKREADRLMLRIKEDNNADAWIKIID